MRITYDYQAFHQEYGGISRYFYEIANRIAGVEGNKTDILAFLYHNNYIHNADKARVRGVKIPCFPRSGRLVAAANDILSRALLPHRQDADIFHETYYSRTDFCPRSVKRVITVYDMISEKFAGNCPQDKTSQVKAHAVHRADHVICISENTRQDLIELLGVPEEKTSVVYLGYSLTSMRGQGKPAVGPKPYILYVGQRGEYKNFEGLLRAYAGSPLLKKEFSLVCFGGGGITERESMLINSLNLASDSVMQLAGGDDLLVSLYASAAVFVYPSLYEGFGIPPLEAMSLDCPVACANTSSLPEVVGDAAALFDPADESDMRAVIERVVSTPDHAEFLAQKGRSRLSLFSWDKCARDTIKVYEKLLQG